MARPERHDVDYFPFVVKRGRTLNILQSKYGLEGIGFFTNLLRFLAVTPDHHYCIANKIDRMNFFAEIGMEKEDIGIAIIELLVETEKLNRELWENNKVIVSEDFLLSIRDAYQRRANNIITIDEIKEKYSNCTTEIPQTDTITPQEGNFSDNNPTEGYNNPQTKLKETKRKEKKLNSGCAGDNSSLPKKIKEPKKPLREREPINDMERVEKVYLQNWDFLYSQNFVKTTDPVVNWTKTRKLLKDHFEKLKPEVIIQALNKGMKDEWIVSKGYSLEIMLSAAVINRLINTSPSTADVNQQNKKSLE